MNREKEIFFESIGFVHYPIIVYYLLRKYAIRVFDFRCDLKKSFFLRYLINTGRLTRIYIQPNTPEHGQAIDQAQRIYESLKNNPLALAIERLYQSSLIHQIFKKVLVEDIFRCIYIHSYLVAQEKSSDASKRRFFFSTDYQNTRELISCYGSYNFVQLSNIKITRWNLPLESLRRVLVKLFFILGSFVYVFLKSLFLFLGKIKKDKARKSGRFKYAFLLHAPFHLESSGGRGFDFLCDGKDINSGNSVFIVIFPAASQVLLKCGRKGYTFYNAFSRTGFLNLAARNYDLGFLWETMRSLWKLPLSWHAPSSFIKAFFISLMTYVNWKIFFQELSFDSLIYMNRENAAQIASNILLSQENSKSWYCACSLGGGYLYSRDDNFKNCRNTLWSFLCFDYYVGINQDVNKYYALHYQSARKYYGVGSIYSEMIKQEINNVSRQEFIARHFRLPSAENSKIVAFFDTTFIDSPDCLTNYEDCITFYQDVGRLLESREDIFVVIKPSKMLKRFTSKRAQGFSPGKSSIIASLWYQLKASPRVFLIDGVTDKNYFVNFDKNNAIIAVSDLVVTHCMSSPTIEALGAGKKSFWYEPGDKHRGIAYDSIPGLLVHGYDALKSRVDYLLDDISDSQYKEYLDKYIKNRIEANLDGLALTRLRDLLKSG
ncbi:MAG: hypothetical protein ABH952_03445 [Candidatus Omnitrophota bacterium]